MIDKGDQFVSLKKHLSSLSELFVEGNEQGRQREKPDTGMTRAAGSSVINSAPISCAKGKDCCDRKASGAVLCEMDMCKAFLNVKGCTDSRRGTDAECNAIGLNESAH